MFTLPKKFKSILVSMLYGIMVSMPAVADDIEIYTTSGSTTSVTQANVLFVLDTSGSMSAQVFTRDPYDPSTTYTGGNACYNKDRVYAMIDPYDFLYAGNSGVTNAEVLCQFSSGDFNYYVRQVNRTAVVCSAADSLDSTGFYTGKMSQYRNNDWSSNMAVNDLTAYIECEVDSGVHGQTAGDSKKWASKNSPPAWSSSSSDEVNWGSVGFSKSMFSGNYLNYIITTPVTSSQSRIDIMRDVMTNLVNSITGINVGLMRFSENAEGGMVVTPVDDIGPIGATGSGTHRKDFIDELNKMTADGLTPLSTTFYEAVMYYKGGKVDFGKDSTDTNGDYPSVSASKSGNNYISPISNECQKNYVVLLTDGDPYYDDLSSSTRKSRIGTDVAASSCGGIDNSGFSIDNCLDEIARSIGTNDQSSAVDGDQFISTFTIGFANANPLLQQTADESAAATGVGERFFADNALSLADTLNNIIVNVYESNTSFSSPAVSVNAFNRSTHLEDLYFTLFSPAIGQHWAGNLKKYKLDFFTDTSDVDNDGDTTERLPFIADKLGNNAVDAATGFFADTARSFWSEDVDGSTVEKGGIAGEFVNGGLRNVYTFTGAYTNTNGVYKPNGTSGKLTSSTNAVDKTNSAIVEGISMLNIVGLPDKFSGIPRRETLLDWTSGLDVFDLYGAKGTTTDKRQEVGDPLHSQPALVQYGGTISAPDLVAYVATNDGYLHAIDADDGTEIFSFIPQELLSNLNELMDNKAGSKTYGLDGDVVAWIKDNDENGIIDGSDHVYLYVGMRRGGKNIYSIDVTDRSNPELRWVIKGGVGDFTELGQTWSSVNVETIKDGSTEKTVLIFGGGYDTNQDGVTVRTSDSEGRAVYIVDADSGKQLWAATAAGSSAAELDMDYSIPSRVKPLDMSGDGYIDRLYVADMGGQIFRFDIDNDNNLALTSSVSGGRIADLADSGKANARRFFYPPDVALIAERGESAYLALAITSGYRAHPLDLEIHDRIYLLKDNDVYDKPTSYAVITESKLFNTTLNLIGGDGTKAENVTAAASLDAKEGWYIELDDQTGTNTWVGEKGLSEVLILNGVVIATTFTPANTSAPGSSCGPQAGSGRVYFMDILDGTAAFPSNTDSRSDRYKNLAKTGIPPSPNVIITKGGEPTLCVGTECGKAEFGLGARKTYWYEEN